MALSDLYREQSERLARVERHIDDLANSTEALKFPVVYERDKCTGRTSRASCDYSIRWSDS